MSKSHHQVKSEIQQVEEKLALLRTKERTILEEKKKLDNEKIINDANVKRQLSQLETEREEVIKYDLQTVKEQKH